MPSTRHPEALAEGSTHVSTFDNNRRAAFTLAEVLITLGIIGIVAAMTIPTLISNYNKRQTVSKLKQAYSILSQTLTMAQVKEGDPTTWDVAGIYGTPTNDPNFSHRNAITKFATKYFIPYLKVSKDFGYIQEASINYDGPYSPVTNNYSTGRGTYKYRILLPNNIFISIGIGTSGCVGGTNPDGSCVSTEFRNITFHVDINGFNKPNTFGKDVFSMSFNLNKRTLEFTHYDSYGYDRDDYRRICAQSTSDSVCGYLIYLDGWQIKDDYPW